MEDLVIKVGGMSCQGCVRSVTGALKALPGIDAVEVSLEAGEARVRFDAAQVAEERLREAILDAGFEVG